MLLGHELHRLIKEGGGVVNTAIVVGSTHSILYVPSPSLLCEHGGHIDLTKYWAKSLHKQMGYVKRKGSNAGKLVVPHFGKLTKEFLAGLKAEVVMNDIHKELTSNWDQTGLQFVPTCQWTMHQAKAKMIPVANSDDKRQIIAVLAATIAGEYLHPC